MIYLFAEKTGWSKKEILKCTLVELTLMMADAPKINRKKKTETKEFESDEDLANWFGL